MGKILIMLLIWGLIGGYLLGIYVPSPALGVYKPLVMHNVATAVMSDPGTDVLVQRGVAHFNSLCNLIR